MTYMLSLDKKTIPVRVVDVARAYCWANSLGRLSGSGVASARVLVLTAAKTLLAEVCPAEDLEAVHESLDREGGVTAAELRVALDEVCRRRLGGAS